MTLNDLTSTRLREMNRELENDRIFLSKNPYEGAVQQLTIKWKKRAAELQEAKTQ